MNVQFYLTSGQQLVFAVRRPSDGFMVDPSDLQLKAPTAAPFVFPLVEEPAPNRCSYLADFGPIAAKAGLDEAFEVTIRRADHPDAILDGYPLYFKAGRGYTIAQLFNEVAPAVVAQVGDSLKGLELAIPLALVRRGAQSS